jgi:hypothetical protein
VHSGSVTAARARLSVAVVGVVLLSATACSATTSERSGDLSPTTAGARSVTTERPQDGAAADLQHRPLSNDRKQVDGWTVVSLRAGPDAHGNWAATASVRNDGATRSASLTLTLTRRGHPIVAFVASSRRVARDNVVVLRLRSTERFSRGGYQYTLDDKMSF